MARTDGKPLFNFAHLPQIPVTTSGKSIEDVIVQPLPMASPVSAFHRYSSRSAGAASAGTRRPVSPDRKMVLTPRSAEACLMEGVHPDELRPLGIEHFSEGGTVQGEVARMRAEAYEHARQMKVAAVRAARETLMKSGRSPSSKGGRGSSMDPSRSSLSPGRPVDISEALLASAVSEAHSTGSQSGAGSLAIAEQKRLDRLRQKQAREIQQQIMSQMELTRIQTEMDRHLAMETTRREEFKREVQRKKHEDMQERMKRKLEKQRLEQLQSKRMASMTYEMYRQEQEEKQMKLQQKKEMQRIAQEKERERIRKGDEVKAATQRRFEERQMELAAKMAQMQEADAIRMQKRDESDYLRRERLNHQRQMEEQRLQMVALESAHAEEARIEKLVDKEIRLESRRADRTYYDAALRKQKAEYDAREQKKRAQILADAARAEESKRALLLARQEEEALAVSRKHQEAAHKLLLRKEKQDLEEVAKRDAVERQRRKEEYQRLITLKAVTARSIRMRNFDREKEAAARQRRAAAFELAKHRRTVMSALEQAKKKMDWRIAEEALGEPIAMETMPDYNDLQPEDGPDYNEVFEEELASAEPRGQDNMFADNFGKKLPLMSPVRPSSDKPGHRPLFAAPAEPVRRNTAPGRPITAAQRSFDANAFKLPPIGENSPAERERGDGDDDSAAEPAPPARPETAPQQSEFTMKASALARMLQQAQRDFDVLLSSSPGPGAAAT